MSLPTHLDLFSGIGGFALAAQWAGWQTIGFSEIDPYACKILKRHWPTVPNHGDIRNVPGVHADLITAGFPCQPYSLAGKRGGASDDRALWPELFAVVTRCRPTFFLGENVPGIINMELDRVLDDLEGLNYATRTFVIPACAVDARHRRDRVWIVAHSASVNARPRRPRRSEAGTETAISGENVGNAESGGQKGFTRRVGNDQREGACNPSIGSGLQPVVERASKTMAHTNSRDGHGRSSPLQVGWQRGEGQASDDGFREGAKWCPEPELGRVAHGIPNRSHRLKGLGNAIVPQVAFVILDAMAREPG